ncbi:MAG TPA: GNAT family N-acetyltransferase [Kofleriaceae bacterium]|nr:GNAT family N-acetyltransferase [Kofleriaceae bacterium]
MAFDVRAATERDSAEVAQLIREMIPGVAADARLSWLYHQNPAGRALTWIASENGEVAGCTSYFPFRLQLDDTQRLCALGGDGYVRPKFRRRGLGALLHDAARDGMAAAGIGCMYGAPGAMNLTPLKHGGSREIGHVMRWVRPLRGAAFGIQAPFDQMIGGVLRPRFVPELQPMAHGDARVDAVWRAFASTVPLAAVRDATFYTWRFLEAPAREQHPFVIVDRGQPIGACALQRMPEGRALRIVDLLAVPGAWHRCLSAIARHAADTDAHIVDIKLMALDGRRRAMWRAGYVERDRKPFLVVIPKDGDRRFLDPMRWFYCGADSDLDVLD